MNCTERLVHVQVNGGTQIVTPMARRDVTPGVGLGAGIVGLVV